MPACRDDCSRPRLTLSLTVDRLRPRRDRCACRPCPQTHSSWYLLLILLNSTLSHRTRAAPLPPSPTCKLPHPTIGSFFLTTDDHGRRLGGPPSLGLPWRARPGRWPPPRFRLVVLPRLALHHFRLRFGEVRGPAQLPRDHSDPDPRPPSRVLTYVISKKWHPWSSRRPSRVGLAMWRTLLYWLVTFDRLCV